MNRPAVALVLSVALAGTGCAPLVSPDGPPRGDARGAPAVAGGHAHAHGHVHGHAHGQPHTDRTPDDSGYGHAHGGAGTHAGDRASHDAAATPYAGLQSRPIAALSDRQVADLRAGRGMSLALPAELNGYPGPLHVLELAVPLELTAGQLTAMRELHGGMRREAIAEGEAVIAAEAALDALFRERRATPGAVSRAVEDAAAAHGRLRAAHLRHHLATMDVLTPAQVDRYLRLRGYRDR